MCFMRGASSFFIYNRKPLRTIFYHKKVKNLLVTNILCIFAANYGLKIKQLYFFTNILN